MADDDERYTEPDPESDVNDPSDGLPDPSENVPSPEPPEVGIEAPEAPEPEEVPEGLRAEFWELVFAFNVALFALALGTMLVVFDGNAALGGLGIVVGTLAFAFGVWRYRNREHTP